MNSSGVSAADLNKQSNIEKGFKPLKKVKDVRHGQLTIIENPNTQEQLAVKEKIFNSEKEASQEIAAVKSRMNLNHPNLLSLKDFSSGKKAEFCSSFYWLKTFFEYPKTDAKYRASTLKKEGRYFSDGELTHMLYNVVSAGAHLQRQGLCHGDITPYNIAVDAPNRYRLMENFSNLANPQSSQEQKILAGRGHFTGPEKFQNVIRGKLGAPINIWKNDVFGLGLSMLEVGNAKSTKPVYNKNGTIDVDNLETLKRLFADKHLDNNNLLVSTVNSMVELNENDRPDFIEIAQQLPEYEEVKSFLADRENGTIETQASPYQQTAAQVSPPRQQPQQLQQTPPQGYPAQPPQQQPPQGYAPPQQPPQRPPQQQPPQQPPQSPPQQAPPQQFQPNMRQAAPPQGQPPQQPTQQPPQGYAPPQKQGPPPGYQAPQTQPPAQNYPRQGYAPPNNRPAYQGQPPAPPQNYNRPPQGYAPPANQPRAAPQYGARQGYAPQAGAPPRAAPQYAAPPGQPPQNLRFAQPGQNPHARRPAGYAPQGRPQEVRREPVRHYAPQQAGGRVVAQPTAAGQYRVPGQQPGRVAGQQPARVHQQPQYRPPTGGAGARPVYRAQPGSTPANYYR